MNCLRGDIILSIQNVSRSINGRPILKEINETIYDLLQPGGPVRGQVVGFLAPSGMGKTELFKIIAGLIEPDIGGVFLDGQREPVKAGQVGVLAQDYPLDETRTAIENLMLATHLSGMSEKTGRELAKEKLARFDLWEERNQYPCQLSGGQRQRVAYLQQLLCAKHLMLDDEPFSGLDVIVKQEVADQIFEFANANEKNTIIITSHDARMVCSIADHIWLLGRDHDADGKSIPGARIQKEYDLIELGLAWQDGDIMERPEFTKFVRMIEFEEFPKLR